MKKIGKRKIVILAVLVLCIVIFVVAFQRLQSWLHSEGMHFIGKYGQVHLSHICEGFDQDGNIMESQNVTVDGSITPVIEIRALREFHGKINIDGLPEMEKYKLFPTGGTVVTPYNDNLYSLSGYVFMSSKSPPADKWGRADVWLKDNQVALKFFLFGMDKEYYIFYSDKGMLDIPEIREDFSIDL